MLIFVMMSCKEDPSSVDSDNNTSNNTINQSSLGGKEGDISLYFYDFTHDISSKFFHYSTNTKILNPSTMDPLADTLNLRSFSEYLLTVTKDEFIDQATRELFDETQDSIDINNDGIWSSDSIPDLIFKEHIPWDHKYTLIEKLSWDDDAGRYKPAYGNLQTKKDTLIYNQLESFGSTFDSLIFKSVIDSNITSISELTLIDKDEFTSTIAKITTGEKIIVSDTVIFNRRNVKENSLFRLKSADCNDDGQISEAEIRVSSSDLCNNSSIYTEDVEGGFCDKGNGKLDAEEIFLDLGSKDEIHSGAIYDDKWNEGAEPFQDRNCNNIFDEKEIRVSSSDLCINSIYLEDGEGGFCDNGNGIWDAEEWPDTSNNTVFFNTDLTGSSYIDISKSEWETNDPFFKITSRTDNLIVDYQDVNNPVAKPLPEVYYLEADSTLGDSITFAPKSIVIKVGTPTGWNYLETDNLIISEEDIEIFKKEYNEIEKYETTYSNVIIEQRNSGTEPYCSNLNYDTKESCEAVQAEWIELGEDYFIMKSNWYENEGATYDYHAFRKKPNEDIAKLIHPFYFKYFGYVNDGIWLDKNVYEEIFIYTKGGWLRENEFISHDTLIVAPTGDYYVHTEFQVEADTISVPYTLWKLVGNEIVCKKDNSIVDDYMNCTDESNDLLINDCFKITRTRTVTLIGNGVEYGQRNTIWIAKDSDGPLGIIKSLFETRWSEPIWSQGQNWTENVLWELMDINRSNSTGRNLNRLFTGGIKYIVPSDLKDLDAFNQEPYIPTPLFGLHRLNNPNE